MDPKIFNINNVVGKKPFQGLTISFPNEIIFKEIPVKQIKGTELRIDRLIDESANKRVIAFTDKLGKITLWEGDAYDAIGQWTDSDVQDRLIEMFS